MTRPGDRLRAIARRIVPAGTLERVIDPLVADLQFEDEQARRSGRRWARARVHVAAYLAFSKTIALYAVGAAASSIHQWIAAENFAVGRTLASTAAAIGTLVCFFVALPFTAVLRQVDEHRHAMLLVYLIPQAMPLSIVFGQPLGILIGLRGRYPTRRVRWSVLAMVLATGLLTFVVCAWVIPETNQAFRELVVGRGRVLARGANELTFQELSARIAVLRRQGTAAEAAPFLLSYHTRLAAPAASILWGIFVLGLTTVARRTATTTAIYVLAAATYFVCAVFVVFASDSPNAWMPLPLAIWLPNIVFALSTLALWTLSHARHQPRPAGTA
jgi:lipopolysaccharide export system permease LptF/LptG-like protein